MGFISESTVGWCWPSVVLAGFLPNHDYQVNFGGFRGSSPIDEISRRVTTDQSGAFDSSFNIAYLDGMDQAFARVENVTSGLVSVTC
jgi:hypothetical protein